jgi:CheY-like chemotaxis protein
MNPTTILWADDDVDDIAMMRDVLLRLDHTIQITEVYNGQQALDYLEQGKQLNTLPSLIVLDMNMPMRNGRETLVLLKQDPVLKDIPTAILTTSNSPLDKLFCERYNTPMITKPMNVKKLTEVVLQLLRLGAIPLRRDQ